MLYINCHHYGICGATLEWIKIFLTNRTQKVIVNGYSSSSSEVISEVQQGIVLGPLLFLCYRNLIYICAKSFCDKSFRVVCFHKIYVNDCSIACVKILM